MDGHTDLGRKGEWNEMCREMVVPTIVKINGKDREVNMVPQRRAMETWNERYPDEMWAVYVRPSTQESGVRAVGMTPAFEVLTAQSDRYADEHIEAISYGAYAEMQTFLRVIQDENMTLSKRFKEANA